ncbi:MAG: hypothetical protein EOO99_00540 [Pedobacter sp.]|nr:MAG: hypothetical protein EOO99_00540 [Pedobacter sp.]
MKKLLFFSFVLVAGISVQSAKAQNATGNASDNGVALTTPPPQLTPGVGVNAVTAPPLTVPVAPPVQTLPSPVAPGLPAGNLLPSVPSVPVPPPMPLFGTPPAVSTFTTTLNLPVVPILPPVPPIPARPDVRMPRG